MSMIKKTIFWLKMKKTITKYGQKSLNFGKFRRYKIQNRLNAISRV